MLFSVHGNRDRNPCAPNPAWLAAQEERRAVKMDSLRHGARFLASDGEFWTYDRPDGALSGVYHATRERDGFRDAFAGCADVLVAT